MNLQKYKNSFVSVVLLSALFSSVHTPVAQAASVTATGTNPAVCNQDVGNSASVTAVRLAGGDCVVQFRNVGSTTWTVPAGVTSVSALVIGGGGGGGFGSLGGGGGAGEVLISGITTLSSGVVSGFSAIAVTPAALTTIVIGSGGASGAPSGASATSANWASQSATATKGGDGGPTSFGSVTANGGGGGGGSSPNNNGQPGGSGGGSAISGSGGAVDTSGVSGWTSYKNVGETSSGGLGGGGGAGGLPSSGRGGAGVSTSITGTSVKYAGGGGGWGKLGAENSLEDTTLGGNGRLDTGEWPYAGSSKNTSPGAANTGTGGGAGAPGGSGIVIIRYIPDTTAPTFTNSTNFSIAENTAITTNAATISVNESSTMTITSGTDSARFTLVTSDSVTARIRFLEIPNFEAPADVGTNNVYDIAVRAIDGAGNITNQSISITVTNVNDAPTITTASSAATHTISQAENITSVVTYTGTDVDAGTTLTWSISGTDAADFSINSSSGALAFATNPDFEAPADADINNAYIVVVTLSDGSLTDTQTVTITIANANESASINAPTVSGTINKGINTTITVTINVAGKVRFFVGNKRISTCKERTTSGTYPNNTATCTWKPAVTGRQYLTATLTPTDNTFSSSTSARTEVFVVKRGTTR